MFAGGAVGHAQDPVTRQAARLQATASPIPDSGRISGMGRPESSKPAQRCPWSRWMSHALPCLHALMHSVPGTLHHCTTVGWMSHGTCPTAPHGTPHGTHMDVPRPRPTAPPHGCPTAPPRHSPTAPVPRAPSRCPTAPRHSPQWMSHGTPRHTHPRHTERKKVDVLDLLDLPCSATHPQMACDCPAALAEPVQPDDFLQLVHVRLPCAHRGLLGFGESQEDPRLTQLD